MLLQNKSNVLTRIRVFTLLFIIGLVLSGATAIPLVTEIDWLAKLTSAREALSTTPGSTPAWALWLCKVQDAIHLAADKSNFLFYGTDWLAFGHFAIALAFLGALRDPVRNTWLFTWGMIACALLIPYALIFGGIRGIPFWWRCIDCSFGIIGITPLWLCRKWANELEAGKASSRSSSRLVIADPWR
jgi:hypothetical protein